MLGITYFKNLKSLQFEDRTQGPGKDGKGKYALQSHKSNRCETEFANSFQDAQLDVERHENNAKKRRTMLMWRHAFRKYLGNSTVQ